MGPKQPGPTVFRNIASLPPIGQHEFGGGGGGQSSQRIGRSGGGELLHTQHEVSQRGRGGSGDGQSGVQIAATDAVINERPDGLTFHQTVLQACGNIAAREAHV